MKVLVIASKLHIGGAEKVARDIAFYADREKYVFDYVVYGDSKGDYEIQLEALGCHIIHLPEPSEDYFDHIRALKRLMQEGQYDVVHAHSMFNCGWAMWIGKQIGIPVRVSHSHSALINGGGLIKTAYEKLMRLLILSSATDLVACGIKAGERLFGRNAFHNRGQLVLNGIDVKAFAFEKAHRDAIRRKMNIGDHFVVGHVGHLTKVKNQSFLLELMPQVLEKRPDTMLLFLGEGEDRPVLEQKIRDLKLEKHVIMTGNAANVADYLSAMDVFAFPSLYEGLPLSLLEAQANGLPCVVSDSVPNDVFLTDLIHPLSLHVPKEQWIETILNVKRGNTVHYNQLLRNSDYTVEKSMAKIRSIYEKGHIHD